MIRCATRLNLPCIDSQVASWWTEVEKRTSWLELIAAFVSIIAAVLLALWIQKRDFKDREVQAAADEAQRTSDRKRADEIRAREIADADAKRLADAAEEERLRKHARDEERRYALIIRTYDMLAELVQCSSGHGTAMRLTAGQQGRVDDLAQLYAFEEVPGSRAFATWLRQAFYQLHCEQSGAPGWDVHLSRKSNNIREQVAAWYEKYGPASVTSREEYACEVSPDNDPNSGLILRDPEQAAGDSTNG